MESRYFTLPKQCPYCKARTPVLKVSYNDDGLWFVVCLNCLGRGPSAKTVCQAVELFDRWLEDENEDNR